MRSSILPSLLAALALMACGSGFTAEGDPVGVSGSGGGPHGDAGSPAAGQAGGLFHGDAGSAPSAGDAGSASSAGDGGSTSPGGHGGSASSGGSAVAGAASGGHASGGTSGGSSAGSFSDGGRAQGGSGVGGSPATGLYPGCERDYASAQCGPGPSGISFRYQCASGADPTGCVKDDTGQTQCDCTAIPGVAGAFCCQQNSIGCTVTPSTVGVGSRCSSDRPYLFSNCEVVGNPVPGQCSVVGSGQYCCSDPYSK